MEIFPGKPVKWNGLIGTAEGIFVKRRCDFHCMRRGNGYDGVEGR